LAALTQSPVDPAFVQDPYPFYARAGAGFFHWTDYGLTCTGEAALVNAVFRDRRFGREAPVPVTHAPHLAAFYAIEAHSMLELEPPRHTRLRSLVLRAFTGRRIAALEPEITALCHSLIDRFPTGPFDLLPAYATQVPVIVIARLLGVPEAMAPDLLAWSNAMVGMYQARRTRADEDRAVAASNAFAAFLRGYVADRRRTPGDDLLTHLIAAEEDGARLTTDELVSTCILLLNAGHEATVHTIGNGVRAIAMHGAQGALRDDPARTVEEVLRWDPALHMFTRWCTADAEIGGHLFRRGDQVGLLLAAANRDPALWDRPAVFDPTRTPRPHVSFGAGIHFCVGAPLARLELQVALPVLFDRCPALRLEGTPEYADVYHFHGLRRLMVTVQPSGPGI
jgi:unspecific monooxygenase